MTDTIHLLNQAAEEIAALRRHVEILTAKTSTMDTMAALFYGSMPKRMDACASEDILHLIKGKVSEIDARARTKAVVEAATGFHARDINPPDAEGE